MSVNQLLSFTVPMLWEQILESIALLVTVDRWAFYLPLFLPLIPQTAWGKHAFIKISDTFSKKSTTHQYLNHSPLFQIIFWAHPVIWPVTHASQVEMTVSDSNRLSKMAARSAETHRILNQPNHKSIKWFNFVYSTVEQFFTVGERNTHILKKHTYE